jgi:restriction system protein
MALLTFRWVAARNLNMPSKYDYYATVRNAYLGVSKEIRGMTTEEVDWLAAKQIKKWAEQERRQRERESARQARENEKRASEDLKAWAAKETSAAIDRINAWRNLLSGAIGTSLRLDWTSQLDNRVYPKFEFHAAVPDINAIRVAMLGPAPQMDEIRRRFGVPEAPGMTELIMPFLRSKRQRLEADANMAYAEESKRYQGREAEVVREYNRQAHEYNALLRLARQEYEAKNVTFEKSKEAHNRAVFQFRKSFESGDPDAVQRYFAIVLGETLYPDGFSVDVKTGYEASSRTLVIDFRLPSLEDIPRTVEQKLIASKKVVKPIDMKKKEFDGVYDDIIHQIALRTMHEAFDADHAEHAQAIVFNGWIRGIDQATGKPYDACIISCEAPRTEFLALNLKLVQPKECVRRFKGITAGPLAQLAPVKPILKLDTEDDRFIESKEVLEQYDKGQNLADMPWEDFEHLVRELFAKVFSSPGGEVHVTQASHDRGVDAIAFDPDPIRGGKFVIQAKRYNMVVPVSAVRDLYGTMIAEGATKGILVTTSYYGRESRDFAKDKPMTLIDGANLVHMFQEYGHNVHIELRQKSD